MKQFKFSMQKILEYKTDLEENEKVILEQMHLLYEELCSELKDLQNEYKILQLKNNQICKDGATICEVKVLKDYISDLMDRIGLQQEKIIKAEAEIDKQIAKIIKISQDKTVMEKLKNKYQGAYREQQKKESELFIDDFVNNTNHLKFSS